MSKKTESIEIRVSPELKDALARVSEGKGRTMSETVRSLIEGAVEGRDFPKPQIGETIMLTSAFTRALRAAAIALPVLALAGVYLLTAQAPATASAEIRIFFTEVDADGDDRITVDEVEAFATADGWQPHPECAEFGDPCTIEAFAEAQLARGDVDGSGAVSYPEFEAIMLRDRAEEFLEMDIDENGSLTADEMIGLELYWVAQDAELMADEGIELSAACLAQLEAEEISGIAATCGLETEARIELAVFDADRSGAVSLIEFLSH